MAETEGWIDFNGRKVELADVDDWDFGEVTDAENAFGVDLDDARTSQRIQMGVFISIRRVDQSIPAGALADQVRRMKFSSAIVEKETDETSDPLGADGNGRAVTDESAGLRTTGSRPLATGST